MKPKSFWTHFYLTGAAILWGGSFIAGKAAVAEIPPFALAFLRFFLSTLLLIPLALRSEGKRALAKRKDLPSLAFLGLSGAFLYNIFFLFALKYNPAGETSLVIATNPVLTALAGALYLREPFTTRQVLALSLAFSGAAVVITQGQLASVLAGGIQPHQLIITGAPVCWAAYTVAGKKVMERYPPIISVTYTCAFGSLLLLPFAVPELLKNPWHLVSPSAWAYTAFLTLFVTVLAFLWWYKGLERVEASRAGLFINLVPISGVTLSALLLKEPFHPAYLLGAVMVIGGVLLDQAGRLRLSPLPPEQCSQHGGSPSENHRSDPCGSR